MATTEAPICLICSISGLLMEAGRTNAVKFCQAINIETRGINAERKLTNLVDEAVSAEMVDKPTSPFAPTIVTFIVIWMSVGFVGESELF